MTTYYVPIEFAHETNPLKRWFFHVADKPNATAAGMEALTFWTDPKRCLPKVAVWAPARDVPSVQEMEALRAGYLQTKGGKAREKRFAREVGAAARMQVAS